MKKRAILIEIAIWSAILSTIFTIVIFVYSKIFVEPNIYTIQFKDIDGITKGSPVRFMGLNVGYVTNLKSKNKYVNVSILITKKNMKIPNGTLARVEFYGLGASKSIELMPPEGSCDVGILTGDTIRLADVVDETEGLVEIIEMIEKYVQDIDKTSLGALLDKIKETKDVKIKALEKDLDTLGSQMSQKADKIKIDENDLNDKIKDINKNVEKINKLIKKWFLWYDFFRKDKI